MNRFRCLALLLSGLATVAPAQSLRVSELRVDGKAAAGAVEILQFAPPQRTPAALSLQTGQTLTDGVEIGVPARTVVVLESANGNRIELPPDSRFIPGRASAGGEAHTLAGGSARFDVRRALSFFNVDFNRFVALVRGTVFEAQANAAGGGALEVETGRVTVQREVPTLMQDSGRQLDMLEHDVLDAKTRPRAAWPANEALRRYTHSDEALAQYRADLKRAEAERDRDAQFMAYNNLGLTWLARGEPRNAQAPFNRMLDMAKAGQDEPWRARALNNLGAAALEQNDAKAAVKYLEEALEVNRAMTPQSAQRRVAQVEGNLGLAWRRLGDGAKARDYTERSLQAHVQLAEGRDNAAVARNLESLGNIESDAAKARDLHMRALQMRERLYGESANPEVASSHINLGLLATRMNDERAAVTHYASAVAIREQLFGGRAHALLAEALARHGAALCRTADIDNGIAQQERALAMRMTLSPGPVDAAVVESFEQIAACWAQASRPGREGGDNAKEKMIETLRRLKAYQASGKPGAY